MDANLARICEAFRNSPGNTLHPLLPLIRFPNSVNGRSEPVTLNDHWAMEDFYRLLMPPMVTGMTARQVGKSFSITSGGYLKSIHIPNQRMLYVTPRFSQAKTLATDTLKPIIDGSIFKDYVSPPGFEKSMLKRDFRGGSSMIFSYAFLNADRCRGIPNIQAICFDESQDILEDNVKVILQSMSSSGKPPLAMYTGTPKAMENPHSMRWDKSSQSVLAVKCPHCNYENIGTPIHDLERMISPDVKVKIKCARSSCSRPLNLDQGVLEGWVYRVHLKPENIPFNWGIHAGQPLHPLHYRLDEKWNQLITNIQTYDKEMLWNEIYGWPCGAADQLISRADMHRWQVKENHNDEAYMLRRCREMSFIAVGIDWGGGGNSGSRSYTVISVAGRRMSDNGLEVIRVMKFPKNLNLRDGAAIAVEIADKCAGATRRESVFIAHDSGGSGAAAEVFILQCKFPKRLIIPFAYTGNSGQNIVRPVSSRAGYRDGYTMDKSRSIVVLCEMIKAGHVLLPNLDYAWNQAIGDEHDNDLLSDFTNIYRDVSKRQLSGDAAFIGVKANRSDDTVHSINYACSALWMTVGQYPNSMRQGIEWSRVDAATGPDLDDYDPLEGADTDRTEQLKAVIRKWVAKRKADAEQVDQFD